MADTNDPHYQYTEYIYWCALSDYCDGAISHAEQPYLGHLHRADLPKPMTDREIDNYRKTGALPA